MIIQKQKTKVCNESGDLIQIAKYINGVGVEDSFFECKFLGNTQ